ncbi:MAG: hypothetical protein FWG65_11570 [Turicibacter sp.]|nr:hypothetical protein [Turicibacter sp.]
MKIITILLFSILLLILIVKNTFITIKYISSYIASKSKSQARDCERKNDESLEPIKNKSKRAIDDFIKDEDRGQELSQFTEEISSTIEKILDAHEEKLTEIFKKSLDAHEAKLTKTLEGCNVKSTKIEEDAVKTATPHIASFTDLDDKSYGDKPLGAGILAIIDQYNNAAKEGSFQLRNDFIDKHPRNFGLTHPHYSQLNHEYEHTSFEVKDDDSGSMMLIKCDGKNYLFPKFRIGAADFKKQGLEIFFDADFFARSESILEKPAEVELHASGKKVKSVITRGKLK